MELWGGDISQHVQWKGRDPSLSIGFALFSEWDKGMRYYRTIFPFASLIVARVFPISSQSSFYPRTDE